MKNVRKMVLIALGAGLTAGPVQASAAGPLAGPRQCRLMFRYTEAESVYRSAWRFDPGGGRVEIRLSPIHRPLYSAYRWDGRRLVLDPPLEGERPAGYGAYLDRRGQLVIDRPDTRWKGWVCEPTSAPVAWDAPDAYRNTRRYPWLRDVAEVADGYNQR